MSEIAHVSRSDRLRNHVSQKVRELADGYLAEWPGASAKLAKLRRGVGKEIGEDISLLGPTLVGLHAEHDWLPEGPTDQERAAYTAITLFSWHQQSVRSTAMHQAGWSMGRAVSKLGKLTESEQAVRARFNAMATTTNWNGIVRSARGLIQQFRGHEIPLDYGQLAVDFWNLQNPLFAPNVRLAWGRDYFRNGEEK